MNVTLPERSPGRPYAISLCITCMGRLHDLAFTLPQNLADNADYPDLEFVVLDYHSQDGLESWMSEHARPQIESGRITYARTTEPQSFHMAHSRNVAFRLARGEIVCNVDADNWTGPGFAAALNRLAQQRPQRAIFTKGRQRLRGRIGFFRREWEELLGGYDESLHGYGYDDMDLVHRSYALGFQNMVFPGAHVTRLRTRDRTENFPEKNWRETESRNQQMSAANIAAGRFKANEGRRWGAAVVRRNFQEEIEL